LLDDPADAQPRVLAGARVVGREECRDHRIADELRVGESLLSPREHQPLLLFGCIFERGADAIAISLDLGQSVSHEDVQQIEPSLARLRCPRKRLDLPAIEADKRVAVAGGCNDRES
jgi:hypothetical protein